ncbi:hypothetical protein COLO4_07208 [Corchorus olitorius]|uniref:Homeobox domain-containing protein n=1 Tax=Corchorus olitorius TaxID=93759 RepID=A0A1R3KKG7_9ROSI|nr:hypothetical protein COLO4_07208 [Corchorus olitorius]
MEWQSQEMQEQQQQEEEEYLQFQIQNGICGKVMTDEQMEELRKQIVAYQDITKQLAEMHKTMSAHQDLTGTWLGNPYYEPMLGSFGHKITARQRWTPTPLQLQILENIYNQGNGTPSKQKIKEITVELAQHGQISETNIYNWFQNRRARSKRKMQVSPSEAEGSPQDLAAKERRSKPENMEFLDNSAQGVENFYYQNSDAGLDQLIGKVECSRVYDPYSSNNLVEQYGLLG